MTMPIITRFEPINDSYKYVIHDDDDDDDYGNDDYDDDYDDVDVKIHKR